MAGRKSKNSSAAAVQSEPISKSHFDKSIKELKDILTAQSEEIKQLSTDLQIERDRTDKLESTVSMLKSTLATLKKQSKFNRELEEQI